MGCLWSVSLRLNSANFRGVVCFAYQVFDGLTQWVDWEEWWLRAPPMCRLRVSHWMKGAVRVVCKVIIMGKWKIQTRQRRPSLRGIYQPCGIPSAKQRWQVPLNWWVNPNYNFTRFPFLCCMGSCLLWGETWNCLVSNWGSMMILFINWTRWWFAQGGWFLWLIFKVAER